MQALNKGLITEQWGEDGLCKECSWGNGMAMCKTCPVEPSLQTTQMSMPSGL